MKVSGVLALATLFVCCGLAYANTAIPDDQKASLSVSGRGVAPNSDILLSTGFQQTLVAKSDRSGNFSFSNLTYSSFSDLKFSLDIPPNDRGMVKNSSASHLEFSYDPRGSKARIMGTIGKSGMLTFSVAGAPDPLTQVAGNEGYVVLQTRTGVPLASGKSELVASIVNVGETCCPQMIVPTTPVLLTISSLPLAGGTAVPVPDASVPVLAPQKSTAPYIRPKAVEAPVSEPEKKNDSEGSPKKKKIPYIVQGYVEFDSFIVAHSEIASAASFSSSDYDDTYVGGEKSSADEMRNALLQHIAALGAFMDGRAFMDTLRSLQVSTFHTMRDYTASDAICRFGTLSRSLALSESVANKNRQAFSKILFDRNTQKINSVYSDPGTSGSQLLSDFKKKYCENVDNNGFLTGYCETAAATADLFYNRDVDFTRTFDVPLTFDADFTAAGTSNDKQNLVALFHNLALAPPYMSSEGGAFDPNENLLTTQDGRAINAARQVSGNTFGALVAERAKTTSASTTYMNAILTSLGVSTADAAKLIGANPSYFAQMEIMTKKLFQDPSFYANLYDSAANIDRQRVAMKAIELQQDRDFLESLRRREMLLSVLLDMKMRTDASRAKESGTVVSTK